MLHSYEGMDRIGGSSRVRLLAPLRHRDFRLLWAGLCVSLLGDGVFLVAMAWQVYALTSSPSALGLVGIAMSIPTIVFLIIGGVISDRVDRRRVMLLADLARGSAVGVLALLSLTGSLELWHMCAIVALYGTGTAFFSPAADAIVPDLLPESLLGQANALDQFVRPLALRMAGPALGGLIIEIVGIGSAFALDAASFVVSATALLLMRSGVRPGSASADAEAAAIASGGAPPRRTSVLADLLTGWGYVRRRVWLWATFGSAAVAYLLFMGPAEVLLPYIVKQELGGSAGELGLVFAAGGIGSVASALVIGQFGFPRRAITFMYAVWTLATLAVAGYGMADAIWQLMLAALLFNGLETIGTIVWSTLKQSHVPPELLGRVSSLDWLISIGLLPVSYALTGPASDWLGAEATLIGAGMLGAVITGGALFLPGMRDLEREGATADGEGDGAGVVVEPAVVALVAEAVARIEPVLPVAAVAPTPLSAPVVVAPGAEAPTTFVTSVGPPGWPEPATATRPDGAHSVQ